MHDAAPSPPEELPFIELERRQDEVLRRLDELETAITLLVAEFNHRLAASEA